MISLGSLNPQQREAVLTTEGPVLILAGAGTGKTRVITHRIAYMVSEGIQRSNILAVTFTNKAAREMQERVTELLPKQPKQPRKAKGEEGPPPDRPTICTFHSLCVRILRQHIERLGYKKGFVIFDQSDQLGAVKKILSHISAKGEKTDPGAVLAMLSRFRNGGSQSRGFEDASVVALAEHVRKKYESALRAANAVDFDDLILLTLRLFAEHPAALEACREKYRYVMVDEYQDTNAAQFQLIQYLAGEHQNLCVVGDDDQSIYGWRGAETANLLELEKYFPQVKVIKLEQNYRSTNTILSAANAVIRNNARRRPKSLWSQKGQGTLIQLQTFESDEEEARCVVEQIEYNRIGSRISWGEQAILFRTNQQSRSLETALRKGGVRYHLIGGQSYFDRREVRDFLAFLKMLVNPHDDISLLRIANVPPRGLSDVTMERLLSASQERSCSVFAAMRHTDVQAATLKRTLESVLSFVELIERHAAKLDSEEPVLLQSWIEAFLEEIGYYEDLRKSEKNQDIADNRVRNLKELTASLDRNESPSAAPRRRLEDFLDEITLDGERAADKEAGDEVTLITMHSCKGLEFPHVFIVGMEDGLLPHTRSKSEGTLDEERRLFYVAITRAQETLSMSHCAGRKRYGQVLPCHPSPFLKELPSELVEWSTASAKKPVAAGGATDFFAALRAVTEGS
ncbi:MAG: exodeoxyribonuclease V subunit gamma [Verrucomicrobiales bacterium]|nr:exodeoxyribonuclease V subunit gamma [Verrucomicrobiales bacterium]